MNSSQRLSTNYLRDVWRRRHFAWRLALAEAELAHANTVLGGLWLLLNPLTQMAVYFLVFGLLVNVDRGVDNYLPFLAVGIFTYSYSQRAIINASASIRRNQGLVRTMQFPRSLLPLSASINALILFIPGLIVSLVLAAMTGSTIKTSHLALLAVVALQSCFNLGTGLIGARAVQRFADVSQLLPYIFRLGFYGSGVLYLIDAYIEDTFWSSFYSINPFYSYITLWRSYILDLGHGPEHWISAIAWTATLPIGLAFFTRRESSYGWQP